jgi:hypothetical protein
VIQKYKWYVKYFNKEKNDEENIVLFEDIDKNDIQEFGLYGNRLKMFYDSNGIFHVGKNELSFAFNPQINQEIIKLEPITFKQAHTDFNIKRTSRKIYIDNNSAASSIDKYFFGYKTKIGNILFQPLFVIDEAVCDLYFEIKISGIFDGDISMLLNSKEKSKCHISVNGDSVTYKVRF